MITPIDQYVIDAVRKERRAQKISQAMLATGIGVSKGMISQAESPKYNTKYNFSHINAPDTWAVRRGISSRRNPCEPRV